VKDSNLLKSTKNTLANNKGKVNENGIHSTIEKVETCVQPQTILSASSNTFAVPIAKTGADVSSATSSNAIFHNGSETNGTKIHPSSSIGDPSTVKTGGETSSASLSNEKNQTGDGSNVVQSAHLPKQQNIERESSVGMDPPPPISRISPENGSAPVQRAESIPTLPPLHNRNKTSDKSRNIDDPVPIPLEQSKVSVEYFPITPPPNPVFTILLFPSRLLFYCINFILMNSLYALILGGMWIYLMEDVPLKVYTLGVPSGVVGHSSALGLVSNIIEAVPEEVFEMIRSAQFQFKNLISDLS